MVRKDGAQVIVKKNSLERLQAEGVMNHVIEEAWREGILVHQSLGQASNTLITKESEGSEEINGENNAWEITPEDYE